MKILHIINGLYRGGAENMLYKMSRRYDRDQLEMSVVCLIPGGALEPLIRGQGVPVHNLSMTKGLPSFTKFIQLRTLIHELKPDLIQAWLYHSCLAASLARQRIPVVWNIRHTIFDFRRDNWITFLTWQAVRRMTFIPRLIIYNSKAAAMQHEALGFPREKSRILHNGFDLETFQRDPLAGSRLRGELGIDPGALVVGMIARNHPQKDFASFLSAAAVVSKKIPGIHFLVAGKGFESGNSDISSEVHSAGLSANLHLMGEQTDLPPIMSALDLMVLSSAWGEGFPNVIGEAMACETPCIATDIGESSSIIGDTGMIVEPKQPGQLAQGIETMLKYSEQQRKTLGARARQRIQASYSIDRIVSEYQELYQEVGGRAQTLELRRQQF